MTRFYILLDQQGYRTSTALIII
uniref:Uncharacterized protein n=1 Tax=Anguilla anguilla TaxID=7936 RepID=A0A0E9VMT7_ANGAN